VIFAEINIKKAHYDFYSENRGYEGSTHEFVLDEVNEKLKDKGIETIEVLPVYDFDEMNDLLAKAKAENVYIFSNFPADVTYKRYKIEESDGNSYILADDYSKTSENYRIILLKYKHIQLHIITGASVKSVPDAKILGLSSSHVISVIRKNDPCLINGDYYKNYVRLIIEKSTGSFL
jgi:hypothetical protein